MSSEKDFDVAPVHLPDAGPGRDDAIRNEIVSHYSADGRGRRLLEAALRNAADPAHLTVDDLSAYDELHVGGRPATDRLFARMDLQAGMSLLDAGSGLGGPARHAAAHYGAHVTGVDLTPEYGAVAALLTERTGWADRVSFVTASALDMPFPDGAFDAACTIHTAMNIADRARLYREIRRVLKKDACFGLYDICAGPSGGALPFPLPWATDARASFLFTPQETEAFLRAAGFIVTVTEDARADGLRSLRARAARDGDKVSPKILNLIRAMEGDLCFPWYAICRAAP